MYGSQNEFLLNAKLKNGIYSLYSHVKKPYAYTSSKFNVPKIHHDRKICAFNFNSVDFWYARFAHVGKNLILNIGKNNSVSGLPNLNPSKSISELC